LAVLASAVTNAVTREHSHNPEPLEVRPSINRVPATHLELTNRIAVVGCEALEGVNGHFLRLTIYGLELVNILEVNRVRGLGFHWFGLSQFVRHFHYYNIHRFPFVVKSFLSYFWRVTGRTGDKTAALTPYGVTTCSDGPPYSLPDKRLRRPLADDSGGLSVGAYTA